jgi:hypothetical protein
MKLTLQLLHLCETEFSGGIELAFLLKTAQFALEAAVDELDCVDPLHEFVLG